MTTVQALTLIAVAFAALASWLALRARRLRRAASARWWAEARKGYREMVSQPSGPYLLDVTTAEDGGERRTMTAIHEPLELSPRLKAILEGDAESKEDRS